MKWNLIDATKLNTFSNLLRWNTDAKNLFQAFIMISYHWRLRLLNTNPYVFSLCPYVCKELSDFEALYAQRTWNSHQKTLITKFIMVCRYSAQVRAHQKDNKVLLTSPFSLYLRCEYISKALVLLFNAFAFTHVWNSW